MSRMSSFAFAPRRRTSAAGGWLGASEGGPPPPPSATMWGGDGRLLPPPLLLLVVAPAVLCNSEDCTRYINGIKGEDIILQPVFHGKLSEIIWKKKVNITKKVAEWVDAPYYYSPLVNRATIDPVSGILTIRNISQIDDGKYEAEALVDREYQPTYLCLKTFEPPPAPNLTCTIDDDGILVNCTSVAQYELPWSYRWDYTNMNEIRNVSSTQEHSTVKLPKNTDLSENIICIIDVSRSSVKNAINLMNCGSVGAANLERNRITTATVIPIFIVSIVAIGLICYWFDQRKGRDIPKRHPDEIEPFREADPENELVNTSRREGVSEGHSGEILLHREADSELEIIKTSSTEGVSEGHPDEIQPPCEADPELETIKTPSSTEEATTPES